MSMNQLTFSCLNIFIFTLQDSRGVLVQLSHYCQSPVRIPLLHISRKSANSLPTIRNHFRQEAALGDWLWRNIHAGLFLSDLEWRKVTFCTQPSWTQRKQRENNANPNGQSNLNIIKARGKESCHMRRTNARPRSRLPYTHGQLINWIHAFQLAHLDSWSRKLKGQVKNWSLNDN